MPLASLIGSGVSSVGNLVGGLASANTQYHNQMKLNEQQFRHQQQLMHQQYQYNNAVTQMRDKRAAGLNPYADMSTASNIVSGGSASAGSAAAPDLSHIGSDAVNAFSSLYPLQSEKEQRLAAAEEAISQQRLNIAAMGKVASEAHGQRIQNQLLQDTMEDRKRLAKAEANVAMSDWAVKEQEATSLSLQNTAQVTKNAFLPRQLNQELAESVARIRLMFLQGRVSIAEAKQLASSTAKTQAEAYGVKLNNKFLDTIQLDMIERYALENDALREQIKAAIRENNWGEVEKFFGLVGLATGAFSAGASGARNLSKATKHTSR